MIIEDILGLLTPLGYPVVPFGHEGVKDCIVYNFVPVTSDRIKEQNRLELTIISTDMERGLEMLEDVKRALLSFGDEP